MKRPSHKRRRVLVDKQVQGALARRIALHWICFMSLSVSLTCLLYAIANFDKLSFIESVGMSLKAQAGSIVVLCALLPWFLRDALELSHRFAGPMLRLRHAMKGLADGEEIPPVVFRKNDFWMDVADEMNRVREVVLFKKKSIDEIKPLAEPTIDAALNVDSERPAPPTALPVIPLEFLPGSVVSSV